MNESRIKTSIATEFQVCGESAAGKIRNVGEYGVFVGTDSIPDQGSNVDLSIRTPGGAELRISGLVWWTTEERVGARHRVPGFGVRLLDDSDEYREFWSGLQ